MDKEKALKEMNDRFNQLSHVCYCRDNYLCSACKEQERLAEKIKELKAT